VIAEDADPQLAAKALAYAALTNAGQVCTSTERVYFPRKRARALTDALVEHVKSLRLGPGIDSSTDMGPMIGKTYREKVEHHISDAIERGAKVLTGGRRPRDFDRGYFYEPTVITHVDHSMKIMREETFGPAIPIMEYDSFDDAIALANDCDYGLGACLLTGDPLKDLDQRSFDRQLCWSIWWDETEWGRARIGAGRSGRIP
jgi:betaine-aldehyde dehydrogenase